MTAWNECPTCEGTGKVKEIVTKIPGVSPKMAVKVTHPMYCETLPCPTCAAHFKALHGAVGDAYDHESAVLSRASSEEPDENRARTLKDLAVEYHRKSVVLWGESPFSLCADCQDFVKYQGCFAGKEPLLLSGRNGAGEAITKLTCEAFRART
jgi:hypothetical protein